MKIKGDQGHRLLARRRNFTTVKIITDEGVYGIGDGTVNGRELSVVELPARITSRRR